MSENQERPVHDEDKFRQKVLFKGAEWGKKSLTDLDAGCEHNNEHLLLTEIKGISADPQIGQELFIFRILNAWEEPNSWAELVGQLLDGIEDGKVDSELLAKARIKLKKHKPRVGLGLFLTHNFSKDQDIDITECNVKKEYHPRNGEWSAMDDFYKFGPYYERLMGKIWGIQK